VRILYFGIYSKGDVYPRNRNIMRALAFHGHDLEEIHYELAGSFNDRIKISRNVIELMKFIISVLVSYVSLSVAFCRAKSPEAVIVGHPGYFHIHLARFLCLFCKSRPVLIYDIFIPLYNAIIEDRQLAPNNSLRAKLIHAVEKSCCNQADINLVDTLEHCDYISSEYSVPADRVMRVLVGATPAERSEAHQCKPGSVLNVIFFGTYIPLHGIDTILEAANILSPDHSINFELIGVGQLKPSMLEYARENNLDNVTFTDWIAPDKLLEYIAGFDLGLGIFGSTKKSSRVIPTKIFDMSMIGMPFITSDTPAIREIFSNGINSVLVPPNNASALATAIKDFANTPIEARQGFSDAVKATYDDKMDHSKICNDLVMRLQMEERKIAS
jgi:glycosyltransferase involved in cell wall biosynthesis